MDWVFLIFYKYYQKGGTKDIPYLSTIVAIALLVYVNAVTILMLIFKGKLRELLNITSTAWQNAVLFSLFVVLCVFLAFIMPKDKLEALDRNGQVPKRYNLAVISYVVISICVLTVLLVKSRQW